MIAIPTAGPKRFCWSTHEPTLPLGSRPKAVRHSRILTSIHEIDPTPENSGATLAPPLALLLLLLRPRPSLCSLPLHVFSEQLITLLRRQVCIHRA